MVNGPEGPPTFPAPGSPCSAAQSRFGVRDCQVGVTMRTPCEGPGEEEQEEGAVANTGRPEGVPEAQEGSDSDLDSDLETEGASGRGGWLGPSGQGTRSSRSASLCWIPSGQPVAVPAPCPPLNAPGGIKSSTITTGFQNVTMQKSCQCKMGCPTLKWNESGLGFPNRQEKLS